MTTFNDDEYALEALKLGACGYLLKDAEPRKLIESIHSVLPGGMSLHDHVAAKVMPRLLTQLKKDVQPGSPPLTPRERAIIRLVGEGKSNKEIAAELFLSVGTVKIRSVRSCKRWNCGTVPSWQFMRLKTTLLNRMVRSFF